MSVLAGCNPPRLQEGLQAGGDVPPAAVAATSAGGAEAGATEVAQYGSSEDRPLGAEDEPPPPPPMAADSVRVALLLPLSGPNARLGQAMLNAAQLALFDLADDRFELLPYDTGGYPAGAAEATRLAVADGARLIVGPLLSASVLAVAPGANAAGVPVVAFSSDGAVAGDGVNVMGFLPGAEVERVVRYAARQGHERFALLAPADEYGATVVAAFRAAVATTDSIVTRIEAYAPETVDFAAVVRRLADYDSRRELLLAQRAELENRGDELARRALSRLETLETLGGPPFDALMVADGGERLQAIAAHLPFFDIDPKVARILGTGQWDEPGLGAEPALLGGWFAAPDPGARAPFVDQYARTYGEPPPRLATLAYDATALAAVLGRDATDDPFSDAAITAASGFAGRDGIFRFLPGGLAERGLAVLRVTRDGAEVLDPAPATFEGP